MGKFSDILLTVDYDRTLTSPDASIPERNLEAIRYFMENDGELCISDRVRAYLKTVHTPQQRVFSACCAPFFLAIQMCIRDRSY